MGLIPILKFELVVHNVEKTLIEVCIVISACENVELYSCDYESLDLGY